jgi:hypothetical protein
LVGAATSLGGQAIAAKATRAAKKPADRSAFDRAEVQARAAWADKERALRRQREALDAKKAKARAAWIRDRQAAGRAVGRG